MGELDANDRADRADRIAELQTQLLRERTARRARRELQRIATRSVHAATPDEVVDALLIGVRDLFEAEIASMALPEPGHVRLIHTENHPAPIHDGWQTAPFETELPVVRALDRDATWIELPDEDALSDWPRLAAASRHVQIASYYAVPLRVHHGATPLAALGIGFSRQTDLDGEDRALLAELCDLGADALRRAGELDHARTMAEEVQSALSPVQLPSLPGVQLRRLYRPSVDLAAIGGDWYDALVLDDGAVALVVGDVAGHDTRSAVEMGRVRHVLASHLLVEPDPATALSHTDHYLARHGNDTFATAVVMVIGVDRSHCQVASAGHLPPLLISSSGIHPIPVQPGPPLGAGLGAHRSCTIRLDPGDALIAYTDGLVEQRGVPLDEGVAELIARLDVVSGSEPVDLQRALRAHLDDPDRSDDATALIAVRDPIAEAAPRIGG